MTSTENDEVLRDRALAALPLTDAVFHLLLSLADGPAHGYGILQEVDRRSDGAVRMGTGTLYSAIRRLREQGVIVEVDAPEDDPSEDTRRRYYTLTAFGRLILREEARRLERLVGHARRKAVLGEVG